MNFLKKDSTNYIFCYSSKLTDEIEISMLKQSIRDGWKDNCANILIENFNDLYILYIKNKFIKKIKNYIEEDKYNYLIENKKGIVAGYILFYHKNNYDPKFRKYIRFCDSVIPKLNIINQMIERYVNRNKTKFIIPYESLPTSIKYWEKYFQTNYGINNKEELEELKTKNKLNFLIDNYFCD